MKNKRRMPRFFRAAAIPGVVLCLCFSAGAVADDPPAGDEVMRMVDKNMVAEHSVGVSIMIVHGRSGTRTITSRFWKRGKDESFVEYVSPAREKGKKMLKLGDKLWNYTPEPNDRIITISGHLLRQSVMGSDLSYEDMMENNKLDDLYTAEVIGSETVDERKCWVLLLEAKVPDAAYHSRKIWVDAERWLPLREERFAKSGRLLKITHIEEVFRVAGRWYPKRITFTDKLSRGGGTEYIIDEIDFDEKIPDRMFTKAALRK